MPQGEQSPAKLSVPAVGTVVRRERLLARLDAACPRVWIAAPPGAGKTTLAASYVGASKRVTLWYRLDADDADPATFFYFLGLAAARAAPRRRIALPLLTPEYLPDLPGFVRRFFRSLFERMPADCRLVFDNYHELDGVPVFHDIMRAAMSETPAGCKLIVASRTEPPPALARLIANRELDLLSWEDLRLTPEETQALAGAAVDADTARRLHEQSGGWAAGVILLLRRSGGAAVPLRSAESLFNYFAAEIFDTLAAEVRRLLIRTAFFPDFTPAMAASIDAAVDARAVLATLCRQHCFVDHTGGPDGSYRYHDLFRDFLRAQAGGAAPECRRAAAQVLAACGRAAEAVPLLLENQDWETAAGLIVGQAQSLIVQGRWQTLAGWIDALPQDLRDGTPWLSFWRGVAELPISPRDGRILIERAYDRFAAASDAMGQVLTASAVIEANFHEWGDFSVLDKWIGVLEGFGGAHAPFPSPDIEARVLTGLLMAVAHRRPAHDNTQALVDRLEALLDSDIDPNQKSVTAAFMLWHTYWIGDFAQVRRIHTFAGHLLRENAITPLNNILLRCMKGQGEVFLGDAGGACAVYDEAEAIAQRYGLAFARGSYVLPIQIYRHLSFGDFAAADTAIAEVDRAPFSGPMNASQQMFAKSWLALQRGNPRLAGEHIRAAADLAEKSGSFVARVWNEAGWALVHAAANEAEAARRHIEAARAIVENHRTGLLPYHLKLVEAWLALRRGDLAHCHSSMAEAFAFAAAHGVMNTLQWLPQMMSELCAEALRADIEPQYVRGLIARRGLRPPTADDERWPWPLQVRTLGGFEVLKDDAPLEFPRKTPKKPIALLKALIALGNPGSQGVAEARLIDALWPEGDAAGDALAVNLHRLRKLLGDADAIQVQGGRISLNADVCRVDAWVFERSVERAAQAAAEGRIDECRAHSRQALDLYRGNFLAADVDEAWAVSMRERLRMKLVKHVAATARLLCTHKACDQVIASCQRGLETDDLVESFYQELMRCYGCLGRNAEGLAVYRRMKHTFSVVLGIAPSAASEALYCGLREA